MRLPLLSIAVIVNCLTLSHLAALPAAAADAVAGQVVSVAPLPARITVPGAVDARRIVYRTTGVGNRPARSSAAVYLPPGNPPRGGWPIVAWAHGTTGLADKCAYSIGGPIDAARDWRYLNTWIRQGYAIVASDYVGLGTPGKHPYLNGIVEAHSVVDAVKAVTHVFGSVLSRRWVVIGQSQGGGAALVTARHATTFGGPELDYRGAVATGVPAHLEDVEVNLGPAMPPIALPADTTAYLLYTLSGLRTSYPNLDLNSYLTPFGRRWVDYSETQCLPALSAALAGHPIVFGDVLARPLRDLPNAHELLHNYLGVPVSGYDRPLFIGQGLTDTDVFEPGTLALAAQLYTNHQPLTFRVYPTDHGGTVNASLVDSVPFVRRLFAIHP